MLIRSLIALTIVGGIAAFTVYAQSGDRRNEAETTAPTPAAQTQRAATNGFIMGSGQWTCSDALRIAQSGTPLERGQMFGWLLGYWSSESFDNGQPFLEVLQTAGGQAILSQSLAECGRQPGETQLFVVTQGLVANTLNDLQEADQ